MDTNNLDDDSSPSIDADAPTTAERALTFIRAALALTPLSADGQRAALALGDDIARIFSEQDEAEERRLREEAEERLREEAEETRLREEAEERYRSIIEERRAEAGEAARSAQIDATALRRLQRDLESAEARVRAAEEALAEVVPTHWSTAMLREASSQHERHIEATVKIAEGLGAPRVDLERAIRQHIGQGAVHTSRLALDLLINPLGLPQDAPTGQQRSKQRDPVA